MADRVAVVGEALTQGEVPPAKAAKAAKDDFDFEMDDPFWEQGIRKRNIIINEIADSGDHGASPSTQLPAKAAKAAKDVDYANDLNEIAPYPGFAKGCYTIAKAPDGQKTTVDRARAAMARFYKTGEFDDVDVIAILSEASGEFIERAAIVEFDGNMPRHVAEQIALDEEIQRCSETLPKAQRARAVSWSDLRRLTIKNLLSQVTNS